MTTRFFRYGLENGLSSSTLYLENKHLCGGDWTPRWYPPATIPPNGEGAWQSESGGLMQGTRGWVKYRILRDADGANEGLIYLWWTNPYLGVTRPDWYLAPLTHQAECDDDNDGNNSQFAEYSPADISGLELVIPGVWVNHNPFMLLPPDAFLQPFTTFAAMAIYERMEVRAIIRKKIAAEAPPDFAQPPRKAIQRLETNPDAESFVGHWSAPSLSVFISLIGRRRFHVLISDHTQAQPLEVDTFASLDPDGVVAAVVRDIDYAYVRAESKKTKKDLMKTAVAAAAVERVVRAITEKVSPNGQMLPPRDTGITQKATLVLDPTKLKKLASKNGVTSTKQFSNVVNIIHERLAAASDFILHVGPGIGLALVRIEEDGVLSAYRLHYQRIAPNGIVLVDQDLRFELNIH